MKTEKLTYLPRLEKDIPRPLAEPTRSEWTELASQILTAVNEASTKNFEIVLSADITLQKTYLKHVP